MTSHDREVIILDNPKNTNDMVVAGMNRLMGRLVSNGQELARGNFAIRTFYDARYLRDEVVIYWDKVHE